MLLTQKRSEERTLAASAYEEIAARLVTHDCPPIKRWRDCVFMRDQCLEIGLRLKPGLNRSSEAVQTPQGFELLSSELNPIPATLCTHAGRFHAPRLRAIERGAQEVQRFIVCLQGNRKGMS